MLDPTSDAFVRGNPAPDSPSGTGKIRYGGRRDMNDIYDAAGVQALTHVLKGGGMRGAILSPRTQVL